MKRYTSHPTLFFFSTFLVLLILLGVLPATGRADDSVEIHRLNEFTYQKYSRKGKESSNQEKEKASLSNGQDKFYMIFVNTTSSTSPSSKHGPSKRQVDDQNEEQEREEMVVPQLIQEIHQLIENHRDTYENPGKLEAMEQEGLQLRKRNEIASFNDGEGDMAWSTDSNLVYPISSIQGQTVLYAYLSSSLAQTIPNLEGVLACEPNHYFHFTSPHYNLRDIQLEAGWKTVGLRNTSDLHLSLISQGYFNEDLVHQYDTTYYYPGTAGKDIDIFLIDSGFHFGYQEFANTYERTVRCGYNVTEGRVLTMRSQTICHLVGDGYDHGTEVADVAAGLEHGVAPKANVYGFLLNNQIDLQEADLIAALQYIRTHLFRPHKAVINFSLGEYYSIDEKSPILQYLQDLIREMSQEGAVFVAAAGNEDRSTYDEKGDRMAFYPCSLEDVICVGSIDNVGVSDVVRPTYKDLQSKEMKTAHYKKADYSNYGSTVDLYAPGYAYIVFRDYMGLLMGGIDGGTSFSSPMVAGVAATIMSEHPELKFTTERMRLYLLKLSEKGRIEGLTGDDSHNRFLNNGKHIVYSRDQQYEGCGLRVGNQVCEDACCSREGRCTQDPQLCRTEQGCQVNYGFFYAVYSPEFGRCGYGLGACPPGNCCSWDGYCGQLSDNCNVGCQPDYGFCKKEYIMA